MNKEEIEYKLKELQAKLEEINKKPEFSWWSPEDNRYCAISTAKYGQYKIDKDDENMIFKNANCYKISEKGLCEYDAKAFAARQRIQRTADKLHGFRCGYSQGCFFIYFNYASKDFCVAVNGTYDAFTINFKDEQTAKECLELCRKDFEFLAKGFSND